MTEDVVKEALRATSNQGFGEVIPEEIIGFLQHILDAGPDERMYQDQIGARMALDRSLFWSMTDRLFLTHLIERLEENTNDS